MIDEDVIAAQVGGAVEVVPLGLYLDTHAALADRLRARGLRGRELDLAIVEALPAALALALHGDVTVH